MIEVRVSFSSAKKLIEALQAHGAINIYIKPLAENDNSKQQIYLGPDLAALQQLPLGRVYADITEKGASILKADLRFGWLSETGSIGWAPKAKLIFYPQYPEVRLSGFLDRAAHAPSALMQPVPKAFRKGKGPDGRLLVLGVTPAREIIAYLAAPSSEVAAELSHRFATGGVERLGVFFQLSNAQGNSRARLLDELARIFAMGSIESCRLRKGVLEPCLATNPNSRGYTLEALLGIDPNGRQDPDYLGWELKTLGKGKVTLLTTEPDGGVYASEGPEVFLRRFGAVSNGKTRFVGLHKVGLASAKSGLTLTLPGFDLTKGLLVDPALGMSLQNKDGEVAASWSYVKLTDRWSRKHSRSAYVDCRVVEKGYAFGPNVTLCEGTDIQRFLSAFGSRVAYYDPATSLREATHESKRDLKPRNQFRISVGNKTILYESCETVTL